MASQNSRNGSGATTTPTSDKLPAGFSRATEPPRILPQPERKLGPTDYSKVNDILSGGPPADRKQAEPKTQAPTDPGAGDSGNKAPKPGADDVTPQSPPRPALELDDDDDDGEQPSKSKKRASSLEDFAAAHELKAKDIYDVEVQLGEGFPSMTIGAMKDRVREYTAFETERDDFDDWRVTSQNEVMSARAQVEGVLQRLTRFIAPEQLAEAFADMRQDMQAAQQREQRRLAEFFPQWSDPDVQAADRQRLINHLGTYGFSELEVRNVPDARILKYAFDAMRLMERYQRLKQGTREKLPTTTPPSRKSYRPDSKQQARDMAAKGDVYGAVNKLLGG